MFDDKKQLIQVGAFVFLCLFVFTSSILLVGGDKMFFSDFKSYRVNFSHAQGLGVGSVVSLSGLTVGNIKKINILSATGEVEIVVEVDSDFSQYITKTANASIRTQGALGDKYIYIEPGETDVKVLNEGDLIASSQNSDIMEMIMEKGSELSQVVEAVNELKKIFEQLNAEGRVESIAKNLDKLLLESTLLVGDLRGKKGQNNLQDSIAHLESILSKVDNSNGSLGALINDPTLHNKLVNIFGGAPRKNYLKPLIRETINSQERN